MWWLLLLPLLGCAAQTPIVDGGPFPLAQPSAIPLTIAVTGDPPEAVQSAVLLLKQRGHRVVYDVKAQGVDQHIVIHATVIPEIFGAMSGTVGFADTYYRLSVIVHGVDMATDHILWSSRARYARSVNDPHDGMQNLIASAMFGTSYSDDR